MRPDKARKHDFPNHQQIVERHKERTALREDGVPRNVNVDLNNLSDAVADEDVDTSEVMRTPPNNE